MQLLHGLSLDAEASISEGSGASKPPAGISIGFFIRKEEVHSHDRAKDNTYSASRDLPRI
jgi:hypothetical protein